jgi:hypothetical protein
MRSRVSFFMNKFRKLDFIEYNGGIENSQLIVECRSARPAANQELKFADLASVRTVLRDGTIHRFLHVSNFVQRLPRHRA